MKKIFQVITLTLALNFLALAGAFGYIVQTKKIDRDKVKAIKDIVFPSTQASTQPTLAGGNPTTQPLMKLDELLARTAGRSAGEQVEFIQHSFDAQMATLDRRQRELTDLQGQIELARLQLARDREEFNKQQKALVERQQQQTKNETDKGFQQALEMYTKLPPKQVKDIFKTMPEDQVVQFLQSMPSRTATKILKEFKAPDEQDRLAKLMEKLRGPTGAESAPVATSKG